MSGKKDKITYPESSNYILFISFLEGAAVMGVEIIGAKMIAPYFGSSLYVWSAVLAVTLLGLTSGYYFGGIISEKYPAPKTLYIILALSAFFTALMPITGPAIMNSLLMVDFRAASILASLVFILPSLFCYGMVSPLIIRRLTTDVESTGRKAGLVYAISTVGGILCTFLTGFFFIPEFGLRMSALIVSLFLIPFPLIFFVKNKGTFAFFGFLMFFMFLTFINVAKAFKVSGGTNSNFKETYRSEGLLGTLTIVDYPGNQTRALFINNISQSYMHVPTGRSQWTYVHRMGTYTAFKPKGSKVLLCGMGAGNVVNELTTLGFEVNVVDIEKRMEEIAKQYFALRDGYTFTEDDARHAIKVQKEKYDIVILDISAGENQPLNLYTVEGFTDIKNILKEDGVLYLHYPTVINGEEVLVLKSMLKTLEASGFNTQLINTFPQPDKIVEQIIFASPSGIDLDIQDFSRRDPFSAPFKFPVSGDAVTIKGFDFSEGLVFRDDKPILEKMHQKMVSRYRQDGMSVTIKGLVESGYKII